MFDRPVLSICIPTYNKSGYLYFTLKSIVEQDTFKNTNNVEIIISDDASTDFTKEISMIFVNQFPEKIIYSQNDERLYEKNLEKALSLGNGEVLKLHNDNFTFIDDSLEKIVKQIDQQRVEKFLIFFANGHSLLQRKSICNNLTDLIKATSYLTTNLSGFSIWREDLDEFIEYSQEVFPQLIQTNVLFKLSSKGRKVLIFNEPVFEIQEESKTKLQCEPELLGSNYLSLLKPYIESKHLDKNIYNKEKHDLLMHYMIPIKFSNYCVENISDAKENFRETLKKDYWYNVYFYTSLIDIIKLQFKAKLELIKRKFNKNAYQIHWRERNKQNETTISKGVDMSKIFVGKGSKGHIDVKFSASPNNLLIIENNVTISEGVKFAFGIKELIIVKDCTIIKKGSVVTR